MSLSSPRWDSEGVEDPLILEIVSEEQQKLPGTFLDFGPPLPSRYGVDRLELMVQSPLRVFAYWELREETIRSVLRGVSVQDWPNFQLFLKWKEMASTQTHYFDPGTTDNWWFDTLPESRYQLELGLYWGEHGWIPLLASNELVTPRLALGPAPEGEPPKTQAFLEQLVQQTGIGLPGDSAVAGHAIEAPLQPSPRAAIPTQLAPPSDGSADELNTIVNLPRTSGLRPTSGW